MIWDAEKTQRLLELHQRGYSLRRLADELQVSKKNVRTQLGKLNIQANKVPTACRKCGAHRGAMQWTAAALQQLIDLKMAKTTVPIIAETLGTSPNSVKNKLAKLRQEGMQFPPMTLNRSKPPIEQRNAPSRKLAHANWLAEQKAWLAWIRAPAEQKAQALQRLMQAQLAEINCQKSYDSPLGNPDNTEVVKLAAETAWGPFL